MFQQHPPSPALPPLRQGKGAPFGFSLPPWSNAERGKGWGWGTLLTHCQSPVLRAPFGDDLFCAIIPAKRVMTREQ